MKNILDSRGSLMATAYKNDRTAWRNELLRRLRTLWWLKLPVTTMAITAFLMAYFWVLSHPFFPITVMPLTALDRAIGLRPETLPLYLSLWVYVSLVPALLRTGRELASYGAATLAMSLIGLGIFMLWPTAVPAFDIDWSQYPSMVFLKNLDLTGNACPSLHVAFAVFTAIWLERLLREMDTGRVLRACNWLWCAGILYSTVATLQHVVLDVLGGTILGVIVAAIHLCTVNCSSNVSTQNSQDTQDLQKT